jgi:hypothetical protein
LEDKYEAFTQTSGSAIQQFLASDHSAREKVIERAISSFTEANMIGDDTQMAAAAPKGCYSFWSDRRQCSVPQHCVTFSDMIDEDKTFQHLWNVIAVFRGSRLSEEELKTEINRAFRGESQELLDRFLRWRVRMSEEEI